MQLTPRRHELLSVMCLGVGTLFMYLGYHTQSFISESGIHSIHTKHPDRISEFAGYYVQALHYTAFALTSLFTASLLHYLSSRWVLVLATILFAIYHLGFFYMNTYYFYFSQIVMGLAYSLYNNGEGAYLAEHSSRRTIESNTGLETAVGHTSKQKKSDNNICLYGCRGICMLAIFYFVPSQESSADTKFRIFDENHTQAIYGSFFSLSVIGIILFALMPTKKQYDNIASHSQRVIPSSKDQARTLAKAIVHRNMVLLAFTFMYRGLLVSFMLGILPTTFTFNVALKNDIYIVAFYAVAVGVAEICGGLFVRPLIKRFQKNKLVVTMGIHVLVVSATIILVYLSTPSMATIRPTTGMSHYIPAGRILACVIGWLIGMADFTITMARAVICQIAVPEARMEVFSLTRMYQSTASCIILFLTPVMTVLTWMIVLSIGLVIGTTTFVIVVRRTASVVQPTTDETNIEAKPEETGVSVL